APAAVAARPAVLRRERCCGWPRNLVDAEAGRAVRGAPQVDLAAGLGAAELRTLAVENQGLPSEILARDGERTRHSTRVRSPRGEDAVRRRSQHREPTPPRGGQLRTQLRADPRLTGRISPRTGCRPHADVQQLRDVHVLA